MWWQEHKKQEAGHGAPWHSRSDSHPAWLPATEEAPAFKDPRWSRRAETGTRTCPRAGQSSEKNGDHLKVLPGRPGELWFNQTMKYYAELETNEVELQVPSTRIHLKSTMRGGVGRRNWGTHINVTSLIKSDNLQSIIVPCLWTYNL